MARSKAGIGAAVVAAHEAKVAGILELGDHLAQLQDQLLLLGGQDGSRQPRDRRQHVHGRISALLGNRAVEHDVAVQRAADAVGDGIVVIVAVDEHGEDAGDRARALLSGPRPLQQPRQVAEHARRIAARHRRLAGGEGHVARRMGVARHRVDDEQDVLAVVAQMLGDAHRRLRRKAAHHRAFIARRHDGNRARFLAAERVLQELAHLPSALADEGQDGRVEARRARQHRQQRGLADAGARKDADPLPGTKRGEEVDHADPRLHRLADPLPAHGRGRLAVGRECALALSQRAQAVDRLAQRVDRAAFPGAIGAQGDAAARPRHRSEPGLQGSVERLHRDAVRVDADDLAQRGLADAGKLDAFAEPHEMRQAGQAAGARADLGHGAADPQQRARGKAVGNRPLERIEGVRGRRRGANAVVLSGWALGHRDWLLGAAAGPPLANLSLSWSPRGS